MKMKNESEKTGLKLNIQKTKIMTSSPITSWQIDGEKWKQWQTIFLGSKIIANSISAAMKLKDTCSWKKRYDQPRQHIKKQRLHSPNKGLHSQSYGFSSSHVQIWEVDHKEGRELKTDAFELWCWRRLLTVPWTARRSNQSILKEINPEYSLEGLMLKLKLQYFGHLMRRVNSLEKNPDGGKDCRQEEKGMTEDKMVGWHHWPNGHESEQTPGDGEGQGSLVCCSPWGRKGSDTTERLNNTQDIQTSLVAQAVKNLPAMQET